MQNLNERGAAYIPIAEARGITPHSNKYIKTYGAFMKQQILPPLAAVQIYTKRYQNI